MYSISLIYTFCIMQNLYTCISCTVLILNFTSQCGLNMFYSIEQFSYLLFDFLCSLQRISDFCDSVFANFVADVQ